MFRVERIQEQPPRKLGTKSIHYSVFVVERRGAAPRGGYCRFTRQPNTQQDKLAASAIIRR